MNAIEQCAAAIRALNPELTDGGGEDWEKVLSEKCADRCLTEVARLAQSEEMVEKIVNESSIGPNAVRAVIAAAFRVTGVTP